MRRPWWPHNVYYVYAYSEPGSDRPFYIGKGKRRRAFHHLRPSILAGGKQFFYRKLRKLLASGVQPDVEIIYDNCTEEEAFEAEKYFINFFGRRDNGTGCLCNRTDGGVGAEGVVHSLEQRRRNSEYKRSNPANREHCQKLAESQRKPIEAFDLNSGETLLTFESQHGAKREGFNQGAVSQCIKGKKLHYKGMGWRFTNPSTNDLATRTADGV